MSTVILSINAGSSSLKTTLYNYGSETKLQSLAKAEISNINQQPASIKYSSQSKNDKQDIAGIPDHKAAFEHVLDVFLRDESVKEVQTKDDIKYACHRVVQGGDFEDDQLITKETYEKIEALEDLAPLYGTCEEVRLRMN